MKIKWLDDVEDHDYKAAYAYLTLLLDYDRASVAIGELRRAQLVTRRANDILRAARREPLPLTDPGVMRDQRKLEHGKELSPILVASFGYGSEIADGYHRVSLIYQLDPFADVPLRIASIPQLEHPHHLKAVRVA